MRRKNKLLKLVALFFLVSLPVLSQNDSVARPVFSAYVDGYYAFYKDSVGAGNYQKFPSVSPMTGFGLNIAMITAQYDAEKIRGIVSLQYGDIPRSAWSGRFNNILEAHAGIRLCKKAWLDAGFFRTHFGTEGLLPKENIASSISTTTYFEPYYEAGFRLNFNPAEKWAINLYLINGYNIYEENNSKKSFGALITYALNDKGNLGYSNYTGDDTPAGADTISHLRIHNNLFFNYQLSKLKIQIGADYCIQENSDTLGKNNANMFSGVLGLKYQFTEKCALYTREEYLNDPQGFMTSIIIDKKNQQTGLKIWGATLGAEYKPTDNSYVRLEGRQLMSDENQEIFFWDKKNTNSRLEVLFHMGVSF